MIYINGRFLLQNQTGVNRFAYQICKALCQLGVDFNILCPKGQILDCYDVSFFTISCFGPFKSHLWEQISLPLYLSRRKDKGVLLNFTGIGPILTKNKLITIHDLAFLVNPLWYSKSYAFLYKLLTPLAIKTSRHIITVSEFSKKEIQRFYKVPKDKITVIYNSATSLPKESEYKNMDNRFVLAVSSIDPRKNFGRLLNSFSLLNNKLLNLYVIGGNSKVFAITDYNIDNRVKWLGRVSDKELRWYYEHAECFIYPSLYEGFGIPPLEAMSYGTPVIASNIPPLREVCGDAAIYVDPYDEADIARGIEIVCNDYDLRAKMIARGYARCDFFSWNTSARRLNIIIEQLSKI